MGHTQVSKLTRQFKKTFCEAGLNALGKAVGFCKRKRDITPYRLCLGLVEVFAAGKVETIADIHRAFNARCHTDVQYKPFHNQLAKAQFPEFMRAMCARSLEQLACEALHFTQTSPFARFERIELQDGTSFAVKSTLRELFPGRFRKVSPAAVELHVTLDLLSEQASSIVLTPDTDSEAQYLPDPESLAACLVMGDRGYFKKEYLRDVAKHGGHFIIKGKASMNPRVVFAASEDGVERRGWCNKGLREIKGKLLKRQRMDMDVEWPLKGGPFRCRLIVSWNPETKEYQYLLTNLSRAEFSIDDIVDGYRLRWQIELMFKEWKSHANLRAFDTSNPYIAEGLVWSSLCAAILTRYYAQMAQRLTHLPISTQKVAKCIQYVLRDIFHALMHSPRQFNKVIMHALAYLSKNAQRAHPKRDARTGRSKLGLQPVYEVA